MLNLAAKFHCHCCDVICYKQSNYLTHLSTAKHKKNDVRMTVNDNVTINNATTFACDCGKEYKYRQGLWSHKQKCDFTPTRSGNVIREPVAASPAGPTTATQFNATELVLALVSQNKDLQNLLIEQNNKFMEKLTEMSLVTNTMNMNNYTNNNSNNSFNINMFLNDKCKNAINLSDFIKNLDVTVQDLVRTGEVGYIEGISSIFTNGLRELDIYTRPIHCTDLKRETVYVRDQDKWEKEDEDKPRIRKAIKQLTIKNLKQLPNWQIENPECYNTSSKASDVYVTISQKALGGVGQDEDTKFQNTIMKNVFKTVLVDK